MKKRHSSKKICQIATLGLTLGLGVYANAQEFLVQSSMVTIADYDGGPISVAVGDDGVVPDAVDVALAPGQSLPLMSFSLISDNVPDGVYEFTVGITVDDNNDESRRMEAVIETLSLQVSSGTITLTAPTSQSVRVVARRSTGGTISAATGPGGVDLSSVVSVGGGGLVTLNAGALIPLIANGAFSSAMSEMLSKPRHYVYRIAVNQKNSPVVGFRNQAGTTTYPRIRTTCENNTGSESSSVFLFTDGFGAFSEKFPLAYAIQGEFNIVGSTGTFLDPVAFSDACTVGSSDGGTTPPVNVDQDTAELNEEINNIEIPPGDLSENTEVIEQVNNALESGGELAEDLVTQLSSTTTTVPTSTALNSLTTVNQTLALAGTTTQQGGTVSTTSAVNTINSIASALAVVTTRPLSTTEVTQINTLAVNTLSSASNLVTSGSTTEQIIAVVQASSNILSQASAASGKVVSDAVVTQVKELTAKAVTGVINNLPAAATAGVNLNNQAEVQTLMRSNPVVLQAALAASANLPDDTSITIGGAQFTVAELVALNLGGGGAGNPVQGGGNFLAATTGYTVTTDSVSGNMTLSSATEKYVAAKPVSRLVSAAVPDGISFLPNGTAVLVGNGVATELAPTAFDSTGFSNAVTAAGFQLTYRNNGTIAIALGNNERFSGAFGFDNLGTASSCGAISITSPTGNPASADYAFVVNCANGPKQRVTPIPDNDLFYTTVANAGLNASTDRNTGVITIATVGKFKPSFFVTPLVAADQTFWDANKNAENVALRARDANGDGRTDYDVITSTGVQVFYGMP